MKHPTPYQPAAKQGPSHGFITTTIKAISVIVFAIFAVACATVQPNPKIESVEVEYQQAIQTPGIVAAAEADLNNAKQQIATAREYWRENSDDKILDHHLFMARQYLAIAEQRHELAEANAEISAANKERQRIQLNASKAETQQALIRAQRAEKQASIAEREALNAQLAAEQLAAELALVSAQMSERGIVLTLQDIVFDFNSAKLQPGGVRSVEKIATFLADNPDRQLVIEGFTDSIGSEAYNKELSYDRAASVRDVLLRNGISGSRIQTVGFGEAYPVASNKTDEGRQQNRRVEVIIAREDNIEVPGR